MNKCKDCGSINIVDVETFEAWFREGEMIKTRRIYVEYEHGFYIASCPEISKELEVSSSHELTAIITLGNLLREKYNVELLGENLDG